MKNAHAFAKRTAISLLAILLTACGGSDAQDTTPEATPSAIPSTKPSNSGDATKAAEATKESLIAAFNAYDEAYLTKDAGTLVDIGFSPKILKVLIDQGLLPGVTSHQQARYSFVRDFEGLLGVLNSFEASYDLDNLSIETTSSGLSYAIVPTDTAFSFAGSSTTSTGSTVAVFDDGKWYLLNPQDAETIGWIKTAYPSLADVALEPVLMEISQ